MSELSSQVVAVFGTDSSALGQMVQATGARAMTLPLHDLSTFSAGTRTLDVAVVDVRDVGNMPEALPIFKRRHPHTSIVLVCASLDPALMLAAMRAGVNECITEPINQGVIEAAITRVAAQRTPHAAGELFAFLGAKGGVGTTTMAVNVATALASTKQRTLFIDLHVTYGDAAVFFGAEPKFSVVDALENIHRLDVALFKTLVVPTNSGVDLLASSSQGLVWTTDVQRVRRLLDFAVANYRYVVVDCPRSDATVLDALEAANRLVLVTNQELATLRSGSRMAATLRQRYRAERVMIVVSRFDAQSEIGHTDVERVLGSTVKHLVPSDYRTSLDALNTGRPLILTNHSRLAGSLDTLAKELAGMRDTKPTAPKSGGGLLGRLTGRR